MKELSLHILDIVQNSVHAKATEIFIRVIEDIQQNELTITISDNGIGMKQEIVDSILDPFFTTKNKKTGLGIPLLKQHAELAGGNLELKSKQGEGTIVTARFEHNNFDRQPIGNITETITSLIRSYPEIDFVYEHKVNTNEYVLNTKDIKEEIDGIPINSRDIIQFIREMISENLKEIGAI